jgi:hypothetical protein
MKALANVLGIVGVLVVLYALIGRFVGSASVNYALVKTTASGSLTVGNSLLLLALLLKSK